MKLDVTITTNQHSAAFHCSCGKTQMVEPVKKGGSGAIAASAAWAVHVAAEHVTGGTE